MHRSTSCLYNYDQCTTPPLISTAVHILPHQSLITSSSVATLPPKSITNYHLSMIVSVPKSHFFCYIRVQQAFDRFEWCFDKVHCLLWVYQVTLSMLSLLVAVWLSLKCYHHCGHPLFITSDRTATVSLSTQWWISQMSCILSWFQPKRQRNALISCRFLLLKITEQHSSGEH